MIDNSKKLLEGFKKFILRGNVVDLAVGVMIGASFSQVVNSLVEHILTPAISVIAKVPDFSDLFFIINGSKFTYGYFLNSLFSFVLIAFTIYFFIITPINALIAKNKKEEEKEKINTRLCPECMSVIHVKAKKCPFCISVFY